MTEDTLDPRGKEAAERAHLFDFSIELFERNYRELRVFLQYLSNPRVSLPMSGDDMRWLRQAAMSEVIYLLHNFVAAAQSLVDHSRVFYNDLYGRANLMPGYQQEITARFIDDPLTQFVLGLRQMAQHYRLPSISLVTSFTNASDGGKLEISLKLRIEDLKEFSGWNSAAKKFLDAAGESIDLKAIAARYHEQVMSFYEWFRQQQKSVHGLGPAIHAHLTRFGLQFPEARIIEQLRQNISALSSTPGDELTFEQILDALSPGLTAIDQRTLLLCQHDVHVWIAEAMSVLTSRFPKAEELRPSLLGRRVALL